MDSEATAQAIAVEHSLTSAVIACPSAFALPAASWPTGCDALSAGSLTTTAARTRGVESATPLA